MTVDGVTGEIGLKNLMAAFFAAVQEFKALEKDATNPVFHSRYATIAAIQEAAFGALYKNGLMVLQHVRTEPLADGGLFVVVGATLYHVESGEQITQEIGLRPVKSEPQGVGSAITYGRRYLLMTMLGLAADDDDGTAVSNISNRVQDGKGYVQRSPSVAPAPRAQGAQRPAEQTAKPVVNIEVKPSPLPRPDWNGVAEATAWAVDCGVYADANKARAALKQVMQAIYPGRESVKAHELPLVLDAWYTNVSKRISVGEASDRE